MVSYKTDSEVNVYAKSCKILETEEVLKPNLQNEVV